MGYALACNSFAPSSSPSDTGGVSQSPNFPWNSDSYSYLIKYKHGFAGQMLDVGYSLQIPLNRLSYNLPLGF
jgi:hypothetical protein